MTSGVPWTDSARGDGFAGQKTGRPYGGKQRINGRGGADMEPYNRTCPQYYARSPALIGLFNDLDDYESGRMGPVDDMELAHLVYLRVLSAERKSWLRWWEDEMMPDPK